MIDRLILIPTLKMNNMLDNKHIKHTIKKVACEVNSASTLNFRLPIKVAQTNANSNIGSDHSDIIYNSKILLAEDNVINQEVTVDMLETMGHTVEIANNGEEAVKMSQKKDYDIVLMDCQMPLLDGYEATKAIRLMERRSHTRHCIIALTGNGLLGDREKCLDAGMSDFLSKPFSYEQLKSIIIKHHRSNINK